ncbi:hypothetical protein [Citrobacter koseri]|uniref:hypothetical protein n=1 Tax=Citrobacter koseri TaxID=545 RepID=UPI002A359C21|nr:hypothetical protein [Citrobacter koseri]
MKTIQLSERELSIVYSLMAPPYRAEDIRSDEFNELRNKVFYALRDARNDEHVSQPYKLPVIGWLRSDYNSDDKRDPNAPLFMLGSNDPTETWGVKYIPLAGNSPVTSDGWQLVPKKLSAENGAKGALSGEFSETKFINCPECFGDEECETCDGSGRIEIRVPVTWTTIKAIWAKGVEHFAAAPQYEARKSNVIGSYQGADGQEHPIVSISSQQEVK